MSYGIVYIATGLTRFLAEAAVSAESVKRHMPDVPIQLFTDAEKVPSDFDRIERVPHEPARRYDKASCLLHTPFERTVFLDTDTYLTHPIGEVFDLLDRFDIAAAHAPARRSHSFAPDGKWIIDGVPDAMAEINTGVVAFRRGPATTAFLERWRDLYTEDIARMAGKSPPDQPSFCKAVYESEVRCCVLPPEYNCRFMFPGSFSGPVKVLHGRPKDGTFEDIAARLNETDGRRFYIPPTQPSGKPFEN